LNGACGNIHPVNFSKGYPEMQAMGKAIKDEVVSAFLNTAPPAPVSPLACASQSVRIPIKRESASKLRTEHLETGDFDSGSGTIAGPVRAIRIGEIGMAFIPCEYFVEFGLEIKRRSPFKTTLVVSVANDYLDYAPTPDQYFKGGYEANTTIFTDQSGRIITDAALELLESIYSSIL
jgi:hypothetical protein